MEISRLSSAELSKLIENAKETLFYKAEKLYNEKLIKLIDSNSQFYPDSWTAVYAFSFGGYLVIDPNADTITNRQKIRQGGLIPLHESLIDRYLSLIKVDENIRRDRDRFTQYISFISSTVNYGEAFKCIPSNLTGIAEDHSDIFIQLYSTNNDLKKYVDMLKKLCHVYLAYGLLI